MRKTTILAVTIAVMSVLIYATVVNAGSEKVTICHVPPGNPGNAQIITVGAPAVAAHLAHGDALGPCVPIGPPPS